MDACRERLLMENSGCPAIVNERSAGGSSRPWEGGHPTAMARQQDWTRHLLLGAALLAAAWALVFLRQRRREARPVYLAPTPACGDDEPATPRQTAGPFFKANTPARTSLIEPGIEGERVILEGYVVSTRCRPVAGARIELWHADRRGLYDLFGYRLRGHQDTDAAGRYRFETIVPGSTGCARAIITSRCKRRAARC